MRLSWNSFLFGHPPKVIWIRRGNCTTGEIAALLHTHHSDILSFEEDATGAFLALG